MIVCKFDRRKTWFPDEGKLQDKFNSNLKIVMKCFFKEKPSKRDTVPPRTIALGVLWKGKAYGLWINQQPIQIPVEISLGPLYIENRIITIEEFIKLFGEEVPKETTIYSYKWLALVKHNGRWYITDELDAQLLVKVGLLADNKKVLIAGLGLAGLGLGLILIKDKEKIREKTGFYANILKERFKEKASKLKEKIPQLYERLRHIR